MPTKKYLYNMKYVPNSMYSFWQEEETANRMLWQRQESQNLIEDFKQNIIFITLKSYTHDVY